MMPLALEPGVKIPIVLRSDEDKENPPTFFVKSFSLRETRQIAEQVDDIVNKNESDELFDAVFKSLSMVLVGWENMNGIEYSPETIEDVIGFAESQELLRKALMTAGTTPDEKKN